MLKRILIVLSAVLVTSLSAFAGTEPSLDWLIAQGGGYTWTVGSTGTLIGTEIAVVNVEGENTPDHPGDTLAFMATLTVTSPNFDALSPDTYNAPDPLLGPTHSLEYDLGSAGSLAVCISDCTTTPVDLLNASVTSLNVLYSTNKPAKGNPYGSVSSNLTSIDLNNITTTFGLGGGGTITTSIGKYFGVSSVDFTEGTMNDGIAKPTLSGGKFSASNFGSGHVLVTTAPEGWSFLGSLGVFGFGLAVFSLARRFGLLKTLNF